MRLAGRRGGGAVQLSAGDWAAGERGIACLPTRVEEFRDGVDQAMVWAEALGCVRVNCLAGLRPDGISEAVLRDTLIGNLRFAADSFGPAGRQVLLEPLNSRDTPRFLVDRSAQALSILDEAARPNLACSTTSFTPR
jgi:hydroxypyruvate isomerase